MEKIPTAKEFMDNAPSNMPTSFVMMTFTKLHVKAALEEAARKATMKLTYPKLYEESNETGLISACAEEISRGGECGIVEIEEDSILNAYPESNIQ